MKRTAAGLVFSVAAAALAQNHHQQAPSDPFRLQPLSGGVHALYGRGGNVGFLVGPDAVLVVDSQFRDLAPGIVEKIRSVTDRPIRYLVNTHHHPDHVGGNEVFRPFAIILAHDNVRKRMLASPEEILREYPARADAARKSGNEEGAKRLDELVAWARKVRVEEIPAPFVTFETDLRIYVGAETVHVWHTPPAHTDGDSVVYFEKAKVLHMGDLLFNKVIPVIDVKGGGMPKGYLPALDSVLARLETGTTVIPGHGDVTDAAGIRAFRQYIVDLTELAKAARASGRTREDFVAGAELSAYRDWSGYPQRFRENAAAAFDEAR
jgi:glyoxylase-like metal-dependent hydrolase (beta-lactamase superfamily II)